jgi:hypothetical protein
MPALSAAPTAAVRTSPRYALVRLASRSLANRAEPAGVLVPDDPRLPSVVLPGRAVDALAAAQPTGEATLRDVIAVSDVATVARLILDGALELDGPHGVVSGPPAWEALYSAQPDLDPRSRLARLSRQAVRAATTADVASAAELSGRLYAYNRLPASAPIRQRYRSPERVRAALGGAGARSGRLRGYAEVPAPGWSCWRARAAADRDDASRFKLYVSPGADDLGDVLGHSIAMASRLGAFGFKVGADLCNLLRPDKFVAYFDDRDAALDAGRILARELRGADAQGVPFSAQLDDTGLVSWGVDPAEHGDLTQGPSWRRWLTDRLAGALWLARTSRGPLEPSAFALARIALEGVDPRTWEPVGARP